MTIELDDHTSLRAANIARQKAWDTNDAITLSYRGNELAGEVGEACNVIKKLERERLGIRGSRDTVAHLAEELADVVICADLIAMSEGIDLDAAVAAKFNATSEKVGLPQRLSSTKSEKVAVKALEWVTEPYGVVAATVMKTEDSILEIVKRQDGKFDLITHRCREDSDRFDDITITVDAKHLIALAALASEPANG